MKQELILLIALALPPWAPAASQPASGAGDPGLSMVPRRCFDSDRHSVDIEDLVVMYNRVVTFRMESILLRSELIGGSIHVRYGSENSVAFFNPLEIANYDAADARTYHARLNGIPVIIWASTVENVPKRAGILGYRAQGLYPICTGIIPVEGLGPLR